MKHNERNTARKAILFTANNHKTYRKNIIQNFSIVKIDFYLRKKINIKQMSRLSFLSFSRFLQMPKMIESNCLIYWINHLSAHKQARLYSFIYLVFCCCCGFGSLNSQKKSVCSPQLFRFCECDGVCVRCFIYTSYKRSTIRPMMIFNKHTHKWKKKQPKSKKSCVLPSCVHI